MSAPDTHPSRKLQDGPRSPREQRAGYRLPETSLHGTVEGATAGIWLWVPNPQLRAWPRSPHEVAFIYLYSMHHVCPKSVICCEVSECFPSTPRCKWGMPLRLCSHTEQERPNKEYCRQSLVCIYNEKVITINNYMKSLWLFPHFQYCTHCKCLISTTLSLMRAADFQNSTWSQKPLLGNVLGKGHPAVPSPRKCAPDSRWHLFRGGETQGGKGFRGWWGLWRCKDQITS